MNDVDVFIENRVKQFITKGEKTFFIKKSKIMSGFMFSYNTQPKHTTGTCTFTC